MFQIGAKDNCIIAKFHTISNELCFHHITWRKYVYIFHLQMWVMVKVTVINDLSENH